MYNCGLRGGGMTSQRHCSPTVFKIYILSYNYKIKKLFKNNNITFIS